MASTETEKHRSRVHPLSPFNNPLHHGNLPVSAQLSSRLDAFNKSKAEVDVEVIEVLDDNPVWDLEHVLGSDAVESIKATGQLAIHAVGDTGFDSFPIRKESDEPQFGMVNPRFRSAQASVIEAMTADCDPNNIERGPAFFLHLGDVIYFDNTEAGYAEQFYTPFANYPRKIIGIPGNHDCEVFLGHQKAPLEAFKANFCQKEPGVPEAASYVQPLREMVAQPGFFWRLDAPFLQIIGLCTNAGEKQGTLRGPAEDANKDAQYNWLVKTLKEVAESQKAEGTKRRALIVALHHPPYTHGNHSPSIRMNKDLDDAFNEAGILPDAILAAHDHDYQRFTRTIDLENGNSIEIPYIVAGGGGRFFHQNSHRDASQPQPVAGVEAVASGGGNGYLIVTARPGKLTFAYNAVDNLDVNVSETIQVILATRKIHRP